MVDEHVAPRLPVLASLADALRLYRLLFLRTVFVAAIIYALIALAQIIHHAISGAVASFLGLVIFLLTLAGPALVQGSLVQIVRNIHEGVRPASVSELFRGTRDRVVPLVGASLVYACGVAGGLLLLVAPGLLVLARWSLMPPLVVLERQKIGEARRRSRDLVIGNERPVLVCLLVGFAVALSVSIPLAFGGYSFGARTFGAFVWSSLTAPFAAHILTVIYYRLSDPERPVIHPDVARWNSVWEGR